MNSYLCYRSGRNVIMHLLYDDHAIRIPTSARNVQIVEAEQIEDIWIRIGPAGAEYDRPIFTTKAEAMREAKAS